MSHPAAPTARCLPCYKPGTRFGNPHFLKQLLHSRRTCFYFAALAEGLVGAGDAVELVQPELFASEVCVGFRSLR